MNKEQIQEYVMQYLDATACQVIEKSPAHVTVKLSPEADKALTNRSYYWSFMERTGADPETMTYSFVFDQEKMEQQSEKSVEKPAAAAPARDPDSILGRYFGVTPSSGAGNALKEQLTYGSGRLQQIFQTVKGSGRFVQLYEEPKQTDSVTTAQYTSWFVVNFKVEFTCDMKREELHSLGISLSTGEIIEEFHSYILTRSLTPKVPANTHLRKTISLQRAQQELYKYLERVIRQYDHTWADEALERMREELERIESYYNDLILAADTELKSEFQEQFQNRTEEIEWQYKPKISVTVINGGIFHLLQDTFR
jgi:hypothetical protein